MRGRRRPAHSTDGLWDRSRGPPRHPGQEHQHAEQDNALRDALARLNDPDHRKALTNKTVIRTPTIRAPETMMNIPAIQAAQPNPSPRSAAVRTHMEDVGLLVHTAAAFTRADKSPYSHSRNVMLSSWGAQVSTPGES